MSSPSLTLSPTGPAPWADLVIDDAGVAPLAARLYGERGRGVPLVLHLHGGAFVSGGLDAGVTVASALAQAGARVLSLAYPLAPAHPFPAALEAGHAALLWLQRQRTRLASAHAPLFVAGEEAGGNLAAALALMSRDRQQPALAGQILVAPMLDPMLGTCSMREADAGVAGCKWAEGWRGYLHRATDACHPYAAPSGSTRLANMPPTLLVFSNGDALRDETHAYARRLREAGVPVLEALIPSASGWPDALQQPDNVSTAWAAELGEQFRVFFAAQASPPLAPG
jgi:acetyl esterase/lipase